MSRRQLKAPKTSGQIEVVAGAAGLPVGTGPLADLGVYVHIPFCVQKCPYCDFVTDPLQPALQRRYLDALEREVRSSPWAGSRVSTLFLGGGTPSELALAELGRLFAAIRSSFDLSTLEEATIECNPGTLTEKQTDTLLQLGFNRISLGVQSFQDRHLKRLGRAHTGAEAKRALCFIRDSGFSRLNVDLIFALPGQAPAEWESDVAEALDFDPGHVSLYHLTFEKGTEFFTRMRKRELIPPDKGVAAEMFESAIRRFESCGYRQYEISNFARPGHECLHNQRYWQNRPTLGVGVSAASYIEGVRWANTRQIATYSETDSNPPPLDFAEALGAPEALGEEIMLRLRTDEGVDLDRVSAKFGLDAPGPYAERIERLIELDLVSWHGPRLRLTRDGLMAADSVCMEFLRQRRE